MGALEDIENQESMVRTGTEGEARDGAVFPASEEVLEGLNDLLRLDHDAVGAYEIAIERLEDRDQASQIEGFRRDHERHIRNLTEVIVSLGGVPATEPHITAPLKEALQRAGAAGGDRGILMAWRANELQVMTKYDGYARRASSWPAEVKRLIDENALDEERHYRWVAEVLGETDPAEVHIANRLRERAAQARATGADAAERAGRIAATARERTAEGLESAADRLERLAMDASGAEGVRGRAAVGAHQAARGLETTASFVRGGGDGGDVRSVLEREIRANPGRSLAATFAIGFVVGRLLR